MNLLSWAGRLYSLDTLDTRFISSTKLPPPRSDPATTSPGENSRDRNAQEALPPGAKPSRWRTPEFMVYYCVFLTAVPLMFWTVIDVSQPSHPNFPNFEHLLSDGWIPGRKVDNSDLQYSSFRDNVPYLLLVVLLHPLLRRLFDTVYKPTTSASNNASSSTQKGNSSPVGRGGDTRDERLNQRTTFDLCFGLVFLIALHGFSAAKVFILLSINYQLATRLKRQHVPIATWVFNIGILFANELGEGYHMARVANLVFPWQGEGDNWGAILDGYGGLVPRWEILFNFTVLRLISFNFDYIWSRDQSGSSSLEVSSCKRIISDKSCNNYANAPKKKQLDPANLSERDRVSISASPTSFSFPVYLSYSLYSPLFLTGPILTFNDYIAQSRYPPTSISFTRTFLYGIRFFIALLAMEIMIHFIYVVAISKSSPDWTIYTPLQLSMLGYFNLHHIWLKLLLPWRFFRWWSLIDGIDPPENMVRCMSDNYSVFAFWRGWHRSFNRWLIRYIYIPMGGSGSSSSSFSTSSTASPPTLIQKAIPLLRPVLNTLTIFTFVAIWHDIQLRLLLWGWLITLFVLPELLATTIFFPARKYSENTYRILCGCGAVLNILMMMAANLVGFALGLDGLRGLVSGIVSSWAGVGFLVVAAGALFTGAQVMFEVREGERRGGWKGV